MTFVDELKQYINGDITGELIPVPLRWNRYLCINWQVYDEWRVAVPVALGHCYNHGTMNRMEQLQALAKYELLFCIPMENWSGIDIVRDRWTKSDEVNGLLAMQAEARRQDREVDEFRDWPKSVIYGRRRKKAKKQL